MVDYAMDIHKSLYHTDDVVARLKALEEAANSSAVQELRADKQHNLQLRLNVETTLVLLNIFTALCTNSDRSVSALCGDTNIMQNWDIACTRGTQPTFSTPLNQVQNRIWLIMHWSLFIFHSNKVIRSPLAAILGYCIYCQQQKMKECEELTLNDEKELKRAVSLLCAIER
ncbi:hypothetical protein R3W88_023380 [Solanum pinnatisectum]|uniref:Uncharacterized protein n=1 Tax=Solanum pinnatisectum TaxID=50273 RepID=A0AAV9M161_9SOLN|nr:hypothetical protein R3W88_023380 [Solanum pinnatisectum]